MKSLSILTLFSLFGSLSLAQEALPGVHFTVETQFTGEGDPTTDLTQLFGDISGTILNRNTVLPFATRQEGVWSPRLNPLAVLTPFGNFLPGNGSTAVKFANFNIPDGASIDLRLGIQGRPDIVPNILFNVSHVSPCTAVFTVNATSNDLVTYAYNGLAC